MKPLSKFRCWILAFMLLFGIYLPAEAYITVPSTSIRIGINEETFLSVPDATQGYIDHATWTCSSPYVVFTDKSDAGAIIKIVQNFTGTAIIELVFVEKYLDDANLTRAVTYYKQFKITCNANDGTEPLSISFAPVEIGIGDIVEITPRVSPYNAIVSYSSYSIKEIGGASVYVDFGQNKVMARGVTPGTTIAEITTSNGISAELKVTVPKPSFGSGITDNEGNSIYDPSLQKSVETMQQLTIRTLQIKQ